MAIGMTVQTISRPVWPATCGGGSAGVEARRRKRRIAMVIRPQTMAATAIAGDEEDVPQVVDDAPLVGHRRGQAAGDDERDEASGDDATQPRTPAVVAHPSISSNPPSPVRRMTEPPSGPNGRPDRARISIASR